jgi:hypothetical protein
MTASTAPVGKIGQVVAKALKDSDLHLKLLAEPKKTLLAMNVPIPLEQSVTVLESNEKRSFFVLPIMTDADLHELKDSLQSVHPNRSARSRVLIKAAEDPNYKKLLLKDPKTALKAEGMTVPDKTHLTVLENSSEHLYIVIPLIHHHPPHQH